MTTKTKHARSKATREQTIAIERFRVRVQAALHTLMKRRGLTQAQLAQRMGITAPRVSQLFADEANVTLRTLGHVLHAMGMEPQVKCDGTTLIVRCAR